MSETIIQIKRSTSNSSPLLQPGELGYTGNGDILFIGSPAGTDTANVIAIAGKRFPGVLTANHALVANNSSWIDAVKTAKLIIGATNETINVTSISTDGTLGTVSNNSLVTSWAVKNYIDTQTGSSTLSGLTDVTISTPANNSLLVYDAAAGQWENHTISGTANEVEVTFSGHDITVGLPDSVTIATQLSVGTVEATGRINAASLGVGDFVKANTTQLFIANGVTLSVNGSVGTANQVLASNGAGLYWRSVDADLNEVIAGSGLTGGGDTGAVTLNVGAGSGITVNSDDIAVNPGSGIAANASGVHVVAGVGIVSNTTGVHVNAGNSQVIANSSGVFIDQTAINHDSLSGFVSNEHIDHSSVSVSAGAGLTGGGDLTSTRTLSVVANSGIVANTDGVFVKPGTGVTVNATGVHIGQSVGTTDGVTFGTVTVSGNLSIGVVNTNIMPVANVTYNLGNNTMRWAEGHFQNVHSVTGKFDGNLEVAGDVIVVGNLVTTNVNSVVVSDPLIYLAGNNTTSDLLDIGFTGTYNDGTNNRHAGLFRDATDEVFKLFTNTTQNLSGNNEINISDATFRIATLQAYLTHGNGGGLNTNATAVAITANSTLSVNIVANTLSLSTALGAASGGTGRSSLTNNAVMFGNGTGQVGLATGTNGQILTIVSNVPTFATLDGGTF